MGRLAWVTQVGPKCNHLYPYKWEAEGVFITQKRRQEDEAERGLKMLALKVGVMSPRDKECWQPLEVGGSKEQSPLEPLEGVQACRYLDFGPVKLIWDFWLPEQ